MTKTYPEKYKAKPKTVFELCQLKDPQQPVRKNTVKYSQNKGDVNKNLMIELNQKQLDYASNVRDQRTDVDS